MSEKYRATLYIDQEIWSWLRKHSIDKRQSASEIIEELIRGYRTQLIEQEAQKQLQSCKQTDQQK